MKCIAICDDIKEINDQIVYYIKEFSKEFSVDFSINTANNAQELYKILEEKNIDLLFLDIELPDINGVEIGNHIRKKLFDDNMQIVYVSGKEEYYIQLFDIRPMHFLKKPFTKNDIYRELNEWIRLNKINNPMFSYKIGQDTFFQEINDIIYFEIAGKKIRMVTTSLDILFYSNINQIEQNLEKFYFTTVHKSYLINMNKIEKYGSKEVIMRGGKKIPVSRRKRDNFLDKILVLEKNRLFIPF